MKFPLKTFFLLAVSISLVGIITATAFKEEPLKFTKDPIEIKNDDKIIILKGAVKKEGYYRVNGSTNLDILINSAEGLQDKADLNSLQQLNQINLKDSDYVYFPFKQASKLLINYSNIYEISLFLNIPNDKAKKIFDKRPFLTAKDVKTELERLSIDLEYLNKIEI